MRAIIFVHPGYLRRADLFDPEEELKEHREDLEYGSYEEYLANMQRLRSVTNGNSIFMGELLDGKAHPYHREFGPSENELFIEWAAQREDSFVLQTYDGGKWKGVRKIKPEELAGFLGESDASSALLAGEMGPYCQSSDGCVGRIHSFLSDSMEVKGVKGCVFPLSLI